jgi:hypothetical protein
MLSITVAYIFFSLSKKEPGQGWRAYAGKGRSAQVSEWKRAALGTRVYCTLLDLYVTGGRYLVYGLWAVRLRDTGRDDSRHIGDSALQWKRQYEKTAGFAKRNQVGRICGLPNLAPRVQRHKLSNCVTHCQCSVKQVDFMKQS